ncbi:MAG: hypothetical protein ABDK94_03515 [Atribacterota bacterium]
MTMGSTAERVDRLEEALMRVPYIQQKTEIEIQNLKNKTRDLKRGCKRSRASRRKGASDPCKSNGEFDQQTGNPGERRFCLFHRDGPQPVF